MSMWWTCLRQLLLSRNHNLRSGWVTVAKEENARTILTPWVLQVSTWEMDHVKAREVVNNTTSPDFSISTSGYRKNRVLKNFLLISRTILTRPVQDTQMWELAHEKARDLLHNTTSPDFSISAWFSCKKRFSNRFPTHANRNISVITWDNIR